MVEPAFASATASRIPSQRRMVIVTGQTGSGKSTLAQVYLRNKPRVLIADAGYQEFNAWDFTQSGFESLVEYLKKHQHSSSFFRASYTPRSSEYPELFDLARLLGPVDFVLEECDRFPLIPEYEELVARGRHSGVSITALSRFPAAIPIDLRREADRIIAFRHHEPADIEWFKKVIGDAALELPNLGLHEFIEWTRDKGTLPRRKLDLNSKDFS